MRDFQLYFIIYISIAFTTRRRSRCTDVIEKYPQISLRRGDMTNKSAQK